MFNTLNVACLALLFISGVTLADVEDSSLANLSSGFTELTSNSAEVTGADPYVVLPLRSNLAVNYTAERRLISLPLQITRPEPAQLQDVVSGELFYKLVGDTLQFDPKFKIRFRFPSEKFAKISIEIADTLNLNVDSLRLDFDNCDACIVSYGTHFQLNERQQAPTENVGSSITPYRTYNGVNELEGTSQSIEPTRWQLNDFKQENRTLSVNGGDPYLISPALDTNTDDLAGVMFNLKRVDQISSIHVGDFQDFQLFYSSERSPFLERESLVFRVAKTSIEEEFSQFKFFIPLSFLKIENHDVLEHLRLDFASHGITSSNHLLSTSWKFIDASLVPQQDVEEYAKIQPIRLARHSSKTFSKRRFVSNTFNRLSNDWGFVIFYGLGLLLLSYYMIRKLIRSKHTG